MKKLYALLFAGIVGLMIVYDGFFVTQEGNMTVVKTMGKADRVESAGFHFKTPFVDSVIDIDVRARKTGGVMELSTSEQMPVNGVVTVNWNVISTDKAVKALYSQYGSLEQFERVVLLPKLLDAAKEGAAKFTAEDQLVKRGEVTNTIKKAFEDKTAGLPIEGIQIQVENLSLPQAYLDSISNKQTQKNNAEAEKFVLEKQNLSARQRENTAQAEANANLMIAQAEAQAIELKGKAEASSIREKAKALEGNPLIIELTKAQNWNGSYATTIIGQGSTPFVDLRDTENKVK